MAGIILHPTTHVDDRGELPAAFFDMRWRFDFAGRPTAFGKWSSPGDSDATKAWCQNRSGLIRAAVEGKDRASGTTAALAECDGHDFVNFKWMAMATAPFRLLGLVQPIHALVGMQLITRDWDIKCFPDGRIVKAPRAPAEREINYATFGR